MFHAQLFFFSAPAWAVPIIKLLLRPQAVCHTENGLLQLRRLLMAKQHKLAEVFMSDMRYVYNRSLLTTYSENSKYETSRKSDRWKSL
jgi:hypothetical protein